MENLYVDTGAYRVKGSIILPTPLGDNLYSVSSAEEAQKLIDDFETQHTVKFSYYMASKGFGGTGEK